MWSALLLLQATATATAAAPTPTGPTIVVTARRLQDTEGALRRCIERQCTPDEEIAAALAHAENQFVAGDYDGARRTLKDAIDRNGRYRRTHPVAVAGLYRAVGRIEAHRGKPDGLRVNSIEALDALRAGLPKDDRRVLLQRIEVADAFAHVAGIDQAEAQYRAAGRAARKAGDPDLEARAALRNAMLFVATSKGRMLQRAEARRLLTTVGAGGEPVLEPYRFAARFLAAVLDEENGSPGAIDAFLAAHQTRKADNPVLLYAPRIGDFVAAADRNKVLGVPPLGIGPPSARDIDQWIDVSFWVLPNGRVGDVDIVRHSPIFADYWADPVRRSIAARRYLPLKLPPDSPGLLRIERYTRTADRIGKGIRGSFVRFETPDLTTDAPAQSVPAAAGAMVQPAG